MPETEISDGRVYSSIVMALADIKASTEYIEKRLLDLAEEMGRHLQTEVAKHLQQIAIASRAEVEAQVQHQQENG